MPIPLSPNDLLGYAASMLVLVTFSARSITTLRIVAMASNLMFIAYAVAAGLPPVLMLHVLLLPLNAWRLWQSAVRARRAAGRSAVAKSPPSAPPGAAAGRAGRGMAPLTRPY